MDAETVIEHIRNLPFEEQRKVREYLDAHALNGTAMGAAKLSPKPGLHPGAMEMAADFDDPLPDEFWLGKE